MSAEQGSKTSIALDRVTKAELDNIGKKNESYDSILRRLIARFKHKKLS